MLDRFESIEAIKLSEVKRQKSEFILKEILPLPVATVNMLSSAGGMGKTFLSIRLANEFVRETGSKVLCWFSEDHNSEVGIRYDTLVKNNIIQESNQDRIFLINTEPKQFAIKEHGVFRANYKELEGLINDCIYNNIKFIIIDPLLAFYGGDENDNSQARVFMQPFVEWSKKQGVTILFIHHAAKAGGTRGAGAFRDAVRTLYELDHILDSSGEIDFDAKDSGKRVLSIVKDNRNAFFYFEKVYGAGSAEVRILPRRIREAQETTYGSN